MQTETGVWEVTYNAENRPIRWEQGETVIEMAFDRLGRRAWMRLTLEGDVLSLTLANPSVAPLTFEAGECTLWKTDDVFRLDGKLVRSPHRNATGEPHDLPRITLGPGEGKTFRWRVTGLAPGQHDCMLYVEEPFLIDGEPACVFRAEIPLLDLSGEPLFFDPLPPDNCELLQERERVGP